MIFRYLTYLNTESIIRDNKTMLVTWTGKNRSTDILRALQKAISHEMARTSKPYDRVETAHLAHGGSPTPWSSRGGNP
jgi:hypothetical protein